MTMWKTSSKEYYRPHKDELPACAVLLTETQAIERLWKRIDKHPKRSDVWPFTYGVGLMASTVLVPGYLFTSHVRNVVKLRGLGLLVTYGPTVIVPAAFAALSQHMVITNKLILGKYKSWTRSQVSSAMLQLSMGWLYPTLLTPAVCYIVGRKYAPAKMPIISDWASVLKLAKRVYLPASGIISISFVLQTLVAFYVVDQQQRAMAILNSEDRSLVKVR